MVLLGRGRGVGNFPFKEDDGANEVSEKGKEEFADSETLGCSSNSNRSYGSNDGGGSRPGPAAE